MLILSSDIFSHLLLSSIYLTSTSFPFSLSGHPSSSFNISGEVPHSDDLQAISTPLRAGVDRCKELLLWDRDPPKRYRYRCDLLKRVKTAGEFCNEIQKKRVVSVDTLGFRLIVILQNVLFRLQIVREYGGPAVLKQRSKSVSGVLFLFLFHFLFSSFFYYFYFFCFPMQWRKRSSHEPNGSPLLAGHQRTCKGDLHLIHQVFHAMCEEEHHKGGLSWTNEAKTTQWRQKQHVFVTRPQSNYQANAYVTAFYASS